MLPPIASQFIGGESLDTVVSQGDELSKDGIQPIYNYLGEHYDQRSPVMDTVDEYEELLSQIEGMDSAISLKPTQLGLNLSRDDFEENARHLVSIADEQDTFVWFDMEHHHTIDSTLFVVKKLMTEYSGAVGVCLQANIRKTSEYMDSLIEAEGETHIRLVKGAYSPPEDIAYLNDTDVDEKYEILIEKALNSMSGRIAVGSHDEDILSHTIEYMGNVESCPDVQFQMLKGVREDRQRELATEFDMAQYIPYGPKWISYTYRRIKENPKNILFISRAILGSVFN